MKRDKYVDIVKGICIVLVVYVHIKMPFNNFPAIRTCFEIFICQFFLAAFFIVSGFYLKNIDKPKEFIKNKIKKMYVKLIIYYIIFVVFHNLFIKLGIYEVGKIYGDKITEIYSIKTMIIKIIQTILLMGREPLLGAMWFFISLIISMVGLTIITYITTKISEKYKIDKFKFTICVLIVLMMISSMLTEIFSITIPRLSISVSAMILIYLGYYFNQILKIKYNNKVLFFISILILICNTFFAEKIMLNKNELINPVTFLTSAVAGLYVLCFIGKKIQDNIVGKIFGICGKYSFYIMTFHLLSFKIAIYLMNILNIEKVTVLSDLEPKTASIIGLIIYLIIGTVISLIIGKSIEFIKYKIENIKTYKINKDKLKLLTKYEK